MSAARHGVALAGMLAVSGCSTIDYYVQAVAGHLELMRRARPIEEEIAQPATSEGLRARLKKVIEIREFASRELALPDNASYRAYADLARPFAVWNLIAAPEFSVHPKESCFPFAGCVSYRGFYSESDARRYAQELGAQGFDTFIAGVPAYSTLGWFDDPVLSTFVNYPETEVARLIFHELAHQMLYVGDDTVFNESFAAAVEQEGVSRWLARSGALAERASWQAFDRRRREFAGLIARYRERLQRFYAQAAGAEEKRAGKRRLFADMRRDYEALKSGWGGFAGYDRYFAREPNNALLASVAAYTEFAPAFAALIAKHGGKLGAFYAEARSLANLQKEERTARLRALAAAAGK